MIKRADPDPTLLARPGGPTVAERRVAAQKAALKANMGRRKGQAQARANGVGEDGGTDAAEE